LPQLPGVILCEINTGLFQETGLQTNYKVSNFCVLPLCASCNLSRIHCYSSDLC